MPERTALDAVYAPELSDGSRFDEYTHGVTASVGFDRLKIGTGYYAGLSCAAGIDVVRRRFGYVYSGEHTSISRLELLPHVNANINFTPREQTSWRYSLSLIERAMKIENMLWLVERPSSSPLVSYGGNSKLKNTTAYMMYFKADRYTAGGITHNLTLGADYYRNAIDHTYTMDMQTGQRTYMAYNVNGNMSAQGNYEIFARFGRGKCFSVNGKTEAGFSRAESRVMGDVVNRYSLTENLKLGWQDRGHRVSLMTEVKGERYERGHSACDDFTAWTCRYGAEGVFSLPKGWGISTDVTLYTRRGFSDGRLNTTDLLWNARLTKSALKGSLVFALDGYDLLRQLSAVTYTVTAQARTEVVSNVIPSYALLHVQWRFNRNPRRR